MSTFDATDNSFRSVFPLFPLPWRQNNGAYGVSTASFRMSGLQQRFLYFRRDTDDYLNFWCEEGEACSVLKVPVATMTNNSGFQKRDIVSRPEKYVTYFAPFANYFTFLSYIFLFSVCKISAFASEFYTKSRCQHTLLRGN